MTKITDILGLSALGYEIAEGYVTERLHPRYDNLRILNYTPKAQFENHWTAVTRETRGLIYNRETYEVLARPFSKLFNYGQSDGRIKAEFDLDASVYHVADKLDGSLGIGYRLPTGEWAIATRGSFDSEQARHATAWLAEYPEVRAWMDTEEEWGCTPLFEIVYPENRIVVNYGERDELVALGSIEIRTGSFHYAVNELVPGAETLNYGTLRDVLAAPVRPNAEGMVVWANPWDAVKIKQADYVELHRVVTGLNRKAIWREVQLGPESFKKFLAQLPDELYSWAQGVADELNEQYAERMRTIDEWYQNIVLWVYNRREELGMTVERREIAELIKLWVPEKYWGYMFSLLDGRDISDKIWRELEPKGGDR